MVEATGLKSTMVGSPSMTWPYWIL